MSGQWLAPVPELRPGRESKQPGAGVVAGVQRCVTGGDDLVHGITVVRPAAHGCCDTHAVVTVRS